MDDTPKQREVPDSARAHQCSALTSPVAAAGAQALFFNHLYDPISLVRDNEIKVALAAAGVHCRSFNADVLFEPWLVLAEGGRPDTCCKDFWDRCAAASSRDMRRVPTGELGGRCCGPDALRSTLRGSVVRAACCKRV